MFAVFGGVHEAARVGYPRCLLDERDGRRSGLNDSAVDLVPDDVITLVAEDGYQERLDTVEVKVVGVGQEFKS